MYKLLVTAFVLVVSISAFTHAATYGGGDGTAEDPYQIWTPQQMNSIGHNTADWAKHFVLMTDIDMSFYSGTMYNIIGNSTTKFTGTFDGKGHVIRNLTYINSFPKSYVGLFGYTKDSTIQNLGLENVNISSYGTGIGSLVGVNSGKVTNCYAISTVSGERVVGGLMGTTGGKISACYANSSVEGREYVGGLTGSNGGNIFACHASCIVNASGEGENLGGFVGSNSGSISACYATGTVIGTEDNMYLGGIAGNNSNNGIISNSYAATSLGYSTFSGGLVGLNLGALVNCYAIGNVGGSISGGIVGDNQFGIIESCFWDIQASAMTGAGTGLGSFEGVIEKKTAEMKILSYFTSAGWDFTNETSNGTNDFWRMCTNGKDYPRLSWESIDGDFACPNGIYTEDINHYIDWWLMNDCTSINNYCSGVDLNYSGVVDLADLTIFAANWLK